jgi:hypothetical protein
VRARVVGLVAASIAAGVASTASARAELRELANGVADQWRGAGAEIVAGTPRFLTEDEVVSVAVPSNAAACVSILFVGARGLSFHVRVAGEDDDDRGSRVTSVAGALVLSRCGGPAIGRVTLTSDGGRGAIETLIAFSPSALPGLRAVLPERTGGALPAAPEPGDLPPLGAPEKRADVAEARAKRDGGVVEPRTISTAGVDGSGATAITLAPGCHKIEVFARDLRGPKAPRHARLDLDAELRGEVDDRLLARDRTDAPDAHIETCVGDELNANLVYAGAPGDAPVVVTHVSWALPQHLPDVWGSDARARMAHALLARHIAAPHAAPVYEVAGGSGTTPMSFPTEPGGCYLAVVAVATGQLKGIGLRALVGAFESTDDRSATEGASAVAFCARDRASASLEVDARGTSTSWGLAVFRVASGIWEVRR